jgi:Leucine-rich repeat (LRR) protein
MATDLYIIESLKEKLNVSYKSDNSGNVIQLNLSGNQLSELPLKVTQLQNLQRLYLRGNQLSKLPIEMAQLQNLQELDLYRILA